MPAPKRFPKRFHPFREAISEECAPRIPSIPIDGPPLRYVPPDSLVEVTCRTIQGRFLLRPSRDLNEIVLGILGRAARRYQVKLCLFVYLSNHCHLLVRAANARQLARFMGFANGNLAKEAGRLHRWRERFWGRRYTAIVVSPTGLPTIPSVRVSILKPIPRPGSVALGE